MLEFLFANPNLPFTIALGLVLLLAGLELVTLVMGFGLSSVVDDWLPDLGVDADMDVDVGVDVDVAPDVGVDVDADAHVDLGADVHPVLTALTWVGVGKVPFLVLMVLFLTAFTTIGLVGQYAALVLSAGTWMFPAWIGWLPAGVLSLAPTRWLAAGIAKVLPKEETTAVSERSFIGRIATITIGTARQGVPTQAKVRDEHGRTHYVLVEPRHMSDVFSMGDEVVLVAGERNRFLAVAGPTMKVGDAAAATEARLASERSEA